MSYRQFQLAAPAGWRGRIGLAVSMALGLGLAVAFILLSIGIAIALLPVVAVAVGIAWWRWRKLASTFRQGTADEADRSAPGRVIEVEYRVRDDGGRSGG